MSDSPNGEIYSPVVDDGFDARDVGGRRAWLLFLGFFGALIAIALVILFTYGGGTRGPDEPPTIGAENTPYKSAPADPGGAQTPNQDISVYDNMNGETRDEEVTLVPDSEEPVDVPTTEQPAGDRMNVQIRGEETQPEPAEQPQTQTKPPAPVTTPPAMTSSSAYYVQISALRSDAEARQAWTTFQGKNSDILPSGSGFNIDRVDRGERGIFYRLRVSGFATRDAAGTFCDRLKSRGQDCLVVR